MEYQTCVTVARESVRWRAGLHEGLEAEVAAFRARRRAELRLDEIEAADQAASNAANEALRRGYMALRARAREKPGEAFLAFRSGKKMEISLLLALPVKEGELPSPPENRIVDDILILDEERIGRLTWWKRDDHLPDPRFVDVGLDVSPRERVLAFLAEQLPLRHFEAVLHGLPKEYRPLELPVGLVSRGPQKLHMTRLGQQWLDGHVVVIGRGRYAILSNERFVEGRGKAGDSEPHALNFGFATFWGIATDPPPTEEYPFMLGFRRGEEDDPRWVWQGMPLLHPNEEERNFLLEKGVAIEQPDHPADREDVKR